MKEHPILFSTEMVQAILAGRKTMTRRIIKWPSVPDGHDYDYEPNIVVKPKDGNWWPHFRHMGPNDIEGPVKCPYGQPGDILWVRETFMPLTQGYGYKADDMIRTGKNPKTGEYYVPRLRWKPTIHMPKLAARIWLEVTDIRVERLQDITEQDAIAEGIERVGDQVKGGFKDYMSFGPSPWMHATNSYFSLWQSINGIESLAENPWVWVISFKVLSTTGKPSK
jgi:hypothetical protein